MPHRDDDPVDLLIAQWRRERPDVDASPAGIIGRISRLAQDLDRSIAAALAEHGLQPGWFDVLAALRRAGSPYELSPTDLVATMMLSSGGVTKRLDKLEALGLIVRDSDPSDGRGVRARLTPDGLARIDAAVVTHLDNEHRIVGTLDADQQATLVDLLKRLAPAVARDES